MVQLRTMGQQSLYIQNTAEDNLKKYRSIEAFAKEHGIDFHPAGTGIGHQLMVELGYVVPGSLCVASDSHSNTYGALGALGAPVVRTDAAAGAGPGHHQVVQPGCGAEAERCKQRVRRLDMQVQPLHEQRPAGP